MVLNFDSIVSNLLVQVLLVADNWFKFSTVYHRVGSMWHLNLSDTIYIWFWYNFCFKKSCTDYFLFSSKSLESFGKNLQKSAENYAFQKIIEILYKAFFTSLSWRQVSYSLGVYQLLLLAFSDASIILLATVWMHPRNKKVEEL